MLLRSTSCRQLAACASLSPNSLWRVANGVISERVWSMSRKNTCHWCPRDFICLALCNRSLHLISALTLQGQSLHEDTLALFMCTYVADTSIGFLITSMFPCESLTHQELRCDYHHHSYKCHVICCFVVLNTSTAPPVLVSSVRTYDVQRVACGARFCVSGRLVAIATHSPPSSVSCWQQATGHFGAQRFCNAQKRIVRGDAWRWH
jgi:hypothetical protein